jgi:hypothetical protein
MKYHNVILAGVARSGSTLSCHLLNKVPTIVALHEPIQPNLIPVTSVEDTVAYVSEFFAEQRKSILEKGCARSKSRKGKVPDNPMGGIDKATGKRIRVLDGNEIKVTKDLQDDFTLVIKQPGFFTGMLGTFKQYFPCYATVRNPLAVLRSWNTVDMAVTDGHAPAAEQCDPMLKATLAAETDVFKRQVILLSWYYEQFYHHIESKNIIRYEEVIISGGRALTCVSPLATVLQEKLSNKNNNHLYNDAIKNILSEALLDSDGFYWKYYSKDDVIDLLKDS